MKYAVFFNENGPRPFHPGHKLVLVTQGDTKDLNAEFAPVRDGSISLAGVPYVLLERVRVWVNIHEARALRWGDIIRMGAVAYEYSGAPPEGTFRALPQDDGVEIGL